MGGYDCRELARSTSHVLIFGKTLGATFECEAGQSVSFMQIFDVDCDNFTCYLIRVGVGLVHT